MAEKEWLDAVGMQVFVSARSADCVTSVLAVAVLWPGVGSGWLKLTLAVLEMVLELTPMLERKFAGTFIVTVNKVLAPLVRVPRLQVTVVTPEQGKTVLRTNVVPVGSMSVTTTLVAPPSSAWAKPAKRESPSGPRGNVISGERSQSLTSIGNLFPQATLKWNQGVNNFMIYGTGNIPVGDYGKSRLANLGLGHGAIDGEFGYTYMNPAQRLEFSAVTGLTYNFANWHTDYQNGLDAHLDIGRDGR